VDNHEKLKTAKTLEITLNRKEGPFESISRTLERLKAGELAEDEIKRIRESFTSLARDCKADQQNFLQSRQFPPDVVQAVRLAMADLFGEFVTADEVLDYSMDKIWELLQTAFDRRQWLTKINKTPPSASTVDQQRLKFYAAQKAIKSTLRYKQIAAMWCRQIPSETCDETAFKQSCYRARKNVTK